jgi:hypothetical protein
MTGGMKMFEAVKIKDKNQWTIKSSRYKFKEDWLLQANQLGFKKFLDWVQFLDKEFSDNVLLTREYYICPEDKVFQEPAGLKVFFTNLKEAQRYCKTLNEV